MTDSAAAGAYAVTAGGSRVRTIWPSRVRPGMLAVERKRAEAIDRLPPLIRTMFENGEIKLYEAKKLQRELKQEAKQQQEKDLAYLEGREERSSLQEPKCRKSWLNLASNDFNELN